MPTNLWTAKMLWQSDSPYYRLKTIINEFHSAKDAIDFCNAPNPDLFICDNDIEKDTSALILGCAEQFFQFTDEQVNVYKYFGSRDQTIDETFYEIVDLKIDDFYKIVGLDRDWTCLRFKVLDPRGDIYRL